VQVREARPDLWGRNISLEELEAQIAKVAADAARAMEQMDDEVYATSMHDDMDADSGSEADEALSDDDEDSEEEDILSQEDVENHMEGLEHIAKKVKTEGDEDEGTLPVMSAIPPALAPTLVDILLPPTKPAPTSSLLSPFTWPCLAGATCRRILHHYKRRRNEVDDDIRLYKQLPVMSRAERRKREEISSQRIFSECVVYDSSSKEEK